LVEMLVAVLTLSKGWFLFDGLQAAPAQRTQIARPLYDPNCCAFNPPDLNKETRNVNQLRHILDCYKRGDPSAGGSKEKKMIASEAVAAQKLIGTAEIARFLKDSLQTQWFDESTSGFNLFPLKDIRTIAQMKSAFGQP